jgi:hypothetical protein
MPNHEEHCQHSLRRYGERADDLHSWIDEPSKKWGQGHRQFRHDTETVKLAGKIFGDRYGRELAQNIALDHIMLDHEEDIKTDTANAPSAPNFANENEVTESKNSHATTKISIMYRQNRNNENVVSLPDSLPPIYISYLSPNRTVIDDIYSEFSDKQKVVNTLQLLDYKPFSIDRLKSECFKTDLEITRLFNYSSQISANQLKDILRYGGYEELIDTSRLEPYKFPKKVFLSLLAPSFVFLLLVLLTNFWGFQALLIVSIFLSYLVAREIEPVLHKNTIKVRGKRYQRQLQDIPQWMRKQN